MQQYLDLLSRIKKEGVEKADRTGTGTKSLFGHQMRFNLEEGFPMMTTKKLHLKSILYELLWFIKGETNLRYLAEHDVHIWDDWPYEKFKNSTDFDGSSIKDFSKRIAMDKDFATQWGNLGPVYGYQWRSWPAPDGKHIDQLLILIEGIKKNPDSRRHIISAWNVPYLQDMALPPCHALFQFYVANKKLSCQLYQRSADAFLGVPFNIASYALLTHLVAQVCNLQVGDFIHTLGDAHIYMNHFTQVETQLARTPKKLPQLKINSAVKNILDFTFEDFELLNYDSHPHIKGEVAV